MEQPPDTPPRRWIDETSRFAPLGLQRLRVIGCIGANPPFAPSAEADIFDAYRRYIQELSAQLANASDPLTVSLLAAGRLLSGDLAAADIVLDHLPAHAIERDHGAGICLAVPLDAVSAALPLPATLQETKGWVQGSAEQTALRAWLAAQRDNLHWVESEGVYRRIETAMITAGQALMIALAATAQPNGQGSIGNVVVEPRDERFMVSIVSVAPAPSHKSGIDNGALVLIEKDTGRVVSVQKQAPSGSGLPLPQPQPGSTPITAARAYENAVTALQGYDNYDKYGRLSVILQPDHYEVTFPPIARSPSARGADYAYQIRLDAETGAILEVLVAS